MASDVPAEPALAGDRALLRLAFLARAGEVLAGSLDYAQTLQQVARLAVSELGDMCIVDIVEDGDLVRVATAHALPAKAQVLTELAERYPARRGSPAPAARVLASGRTELLVNVDPAVVRNHTVDAAHAALIDALDVRSHLAVPMRVRGETIGVLSLGITDTERRYGDDERALAEELARRAALAVENARLYRRAQDEIERRARVEAELRISEQRFRAITEQSPLSTQRLAPDGHTIGVNGAWEALWGLTLADLNGYSVLADPQLDAAGITPLLRRAFAGEPAALPEVRYDPRVTVPGRDHGADPVRWVKGFAYPVRDEAGEIREVVLVHEDITEARRAQQRAEASEDRLQRALAAGGMCTWEWDLATGIIECSANAVEFYGIHVGHADDFLALIDAADLPAVQASAAQALESRRLELLEFRLRGTDRWVQTRGHVQDGDDGAPSKMLGVTVEVTGRREAEAATRMLADAGRVLGASLDYETTLADLATVLVPQLADWYAVDLISERGELERVSVHHGDAERRALAHELHERYPPRRGQGGAWAVIDGGEPQWGAEITDEMLVQAAHDARHLEILRGLGLRAYIVVPLTARGVTFGAITLVMAESGRRYREADVELAMDLARRAASAVDNARLLRQLQLEHRRKDEFLATLAHELRNPLAPIRTGLALLEAAPDADVAERARRIMQRQLGHMVRLIDDLLDLSRVTRDAITLQVRDVALATVVAGAVEASRPLVEAAGLRLHVELPDAPVHLRVDDTRIAQVLTNLLNNAAKFTPRGGEVRLVARAAGDRLLLAVEDTGIGIAPEQLESIFEMFVRGGGPQGPGGLGIGLTLSRRLVELHGGHLRAESAGPGQGASLVMELPLVPAMASGPAPADATAERPAGRAQRVLVVDDNEDAAQTLATLLGFDGHAVRCAGDGPAALAHLDGFEPDIAFLDIGLPGMSGYELAARLRARPGGAGMRLVALTGWGREEDRDRARDAGFDHHLTKPVDPQALLALLPRGH
ncbi:ATP-binding protein [Lysobacter humi (ex Lee et al. 2017)]